MPEKSACASRWLFRCVIGRAMPQGDILGPGAAALPDQGGGRHDCGQREAAEAVTATSNLHYYDGSMSNPPARKLIIDSDGVETVWGGRLHADRSDILRLAQRSSVGYPRPFSELTTVPMAIASW